MSSKPHTLENDSKPAASSLNQKDTLKEKANQQGVFTRYYSALRSVFQKSQTEKSNDSRPKVSPPSESRQTKISLNQQEKIISNKLLASLLGFCFPICGAEAGSGTDENQPLLIFLPCTPQYKRPKTPKKRKPVGMVTYAKDVELCAGKLVFGCECGKKNGLAGGASCPRSCCMNNPGCYMNPPQCWPQFKEDPPPPKIPEQKMICIPIELSYYDPSESR